MVNFVIIPITHLYCFFLILMLSGGNVQSTNNEPQSQKETDPDESELDMFMTGKGDSDIMFPTDES